MARTDSHQWDAVPFFRRIVGAHAQQRDEVPLFRQTAPAALRNLQIKELPQGYQALRQLLHSERTYLLSYRKSGERLAKLGRYRFQSIGQLHQAVADAKLLIAERSDCSEVADASSATALTLLIASESVD
ncbi:hypothetical protein D3H35_21110 [Cohnella faecalis]|uniref:Uncharacterized protein n=1 Tax=Cohnella faecalis TaxID=2315694 RepID=A0A398CVP0_9BACL|nr:hypothetical protein D3H35_21110 [Cohnella faecalis]